MAKVAYKEKYEKMKASVDRGSKAYKELSDQNSELVKEKAKFQHQIDYLRKHVETLTEGLSKANRQTDFWRNEYQTSENYSNMLENNLFEKGKMICQLQTEAFGLQARLTQTEIKLEELQKL